VLELRRRRRSALGRPVYSGYAEVDNPLMELGVNVVRSYEPLLDRAVLDALWANGIRVIDSVHPMVAMTRRW
jgi:hypothetical protein